MAGNISSPWFNMIKRLCKLNRQLPLVKDHLAHRGHTTGAKFFFRQISLKNIRHIKLEFVRTGVSNVNSIIQKEGFINFSLIFFLKMTKQTKGKIIVHL